MTNEILATYAERNVSAEEQKVVLHCLMQHSSELKKVMTLMDEDYELELCDADEFFFARKLGA